MLAAKEHGRKIVDGEIDVQQGELEQADMTLYTEVPIYLELLLGEIEPGSALAAGLIRVEGDPTALHRFLEICRVGANLLSSSL